MTVIGIMKKAHVDTSQSGKPLWPFSSIAQNADSGISSLPVSGDKTKLVEEDGLTDDDGRGGGRRLLKCETLRILRIWPPFIYHYGPPSLFMAKQLVPFGHAELRQTLSSLGGLTSLRCTTRTAPLTWRVAGVVNLGVDGERQRTDEADAPKGGDYPDGTLEAAHRVQMQRMTNGQESLHGERHYCEHGHVRRPAMDLSHGKVIILTQGIIVGAVNSYYGPRVPYVRFRD